MLDLLIDLGAIVGPNWEPKSIPNPSKKHFFLVAAAVERAFRAEGLIFTSKIPGFFFACGGPAKTPS